MEPHKKKSKKGGPDGHDANPEHEQGTPLFLYCLALVGLSLFGRLLVGISVAASAIGSDASSYSLETVMDGSGSMMARARDAVEPPSTNPISSGLDFALLATLGSSVRHLSLCSQRGVCLMGSLDGLAALTCMGSVLALLKLRGSSWVLNALGFSDTASFQPLDENTDESLKSSQPRTDVKDTSPKAASPAGVKSTSDPQQVICDLKRQLRDSQAAACQAEKDRELIWSSRMAMKRASAMQISTMQAEQAALRSENVGLKQENEKLGRQQKQINSWNQQLLQDARHSENSWNTLKAKLAKLEAAPRWESYSPAQDRQEVDTEALLEHNWASVERQDFPGEYNSLLEHNWMGCNDEGDNEGGWDHDIAKDGLEPKVVQGVDTEALLAHNWTSQERDDLPMEYSALLEHNWVANDSLAQGMPMGGLQGTQPEVDNDALLAHNWTSQECDYLPMEYSAQLEHNWMACNDSLAQGTPKGGLDGYSGSPTSVLALLEYNCADWAAMN